MLSEGKRTYGNNLPSYLSQAAKVPVEWEHHVISTHAVTPGGDLISKEALDSVIRNKVGLKGKLYGPSYFVDELL